MATDISKNDGVGYAESLVYSRHELPKGPFSVIVISPRTQITFLAVLVQKGAYLPQKVGDAPGQNRNFISAP